LAIRSFDRSTAGLRRAGITCGLRRDGGAQAWGQDTPLHIAQELFGLLINASPKRQVVLGGAVLPWPRPATVAPIVARTATRQLIYL
jgi:hypothetical protein